MVFYLFETVIKYSVYFSTAFPIGFVNNNMKLTSCTMGSVSTVMAPTKTTMKVKPGDFLKMNVSRGRH